MLSRLYDQGVLTKLQPGDVIVHDKTDKTILFYRSGVRLEIRDEKTQQSDTKISFDLYTILTAISIATGCRLAQEGNVTSDKLTKWQLDASPVYARDL